MSFRQRLALFFLLIVVLPMIALGVLLTQLTRESRTGKADARLSAGLEVAMSVYGDELDQGRLAARDAALDERLTGALRGPGGAGVQDAARELAAVGRLASLSVLNPGGRRLARVGSDEPVAEAEITLRDRDGTLGAVRASTITADAYASRVHDLTDQDVAVLLDGKAVASTVRLGGQEIGSVDADTLDLSGGDARVATVPLGGAEPDARLAMLAPIESAGILETRPVVGAALIAFFAIALFLIVLLVRSLQGQIGGMLGAARRIGEGDFSRELPVEGRDEMAGLAHEFNKMSDRLAAQMARLRRQRAELEQSIRRIGEAFAHGLDREALLNIVAETALAACEAESCRVVLVGRARAEAEVGVAADGTLGEALLEAERAAPHESSEARVARGNAHALARPLIGIHESRNLGAVAIARQGAPFDAGQRELFRYLVAQASVSIENIDLHEVVSEQAITDELTGLSNQRRFRQLVEKEAARAQRFGHQLALLILDIDDFKQVNDTYGHLQGDEVLRMIGRILLEESRGVDEPARYGGEEFVLALPETGDEGAVEVAERIRTRVEQAQIPLLEGPGAIRVTASLGVACLPQAASDVRSLIAAADAALYRAKGGGKNRCELAVPSGQPPWSIAQGQATQRRT